MIIIALLLFFLIIFSIINIIFYKSFEFLDNDITKFYIKHFNRKPDIITYNYYKKNINKFHELWEYKYDVEYGYRLFIKNKIILVGLIRDGIKNINYIMNVYQELKKKCNEIKFIIIENDSIDNTREKLLNYSKKDKNIIILCPDKKTINDKECKLNNYEIKEKDHNPKQPRIKKLSILRNFYIKYIFEQLNWKEYEYLFVFDLDLKGELYIDGIMHSICQINKNPTISGISCNGLIRNKNNYFNEYIYYDSFAYIEKNESIEWDIYFDKTSHDKYVSKYITTKYLESMDLDLVASAFGGFCIYNIKHIYDNRATYSYSKNENKLSCEHSHFNKDLNIYVNPRMLFLIQE